MTFDLEKNKNSLRLALAALDFDRVDSLLAEREGFWTEQRKHTLTLRASNAELRGRRDNAERFRELARALPDPPKGGA